MDELFRSAQNMGIQIQYCSLPLNESVSTPDSKGGLILLDYSLLGMPRRERTHLAHELGHCATGSFYNLYAPLDIRARHEWRANKWAVHHLFSPEEIKKATSLGYTETWQLAEYFDVTEDFIRTALRIYQCEEVLS